VLAVGFVPVVRAFADHTFLYWTRVAYVSQEACLGLRAVPSARGAPGATREWPSLSEALSTLDFGGGQGSSEWASSRHGPLPPQPPHFLLDIRGQAALPLTDHLQQLEPGDQAGVRRLMTGAFPKNAGTQGHQITADIQPAATAEAPGEDVVRFAPQTRLAAPLTRARGAKLVEQILINDDHGRSFLLTTAVRAWVEACGAAWGKGEPAGAVC